MDLKYLYPEAHVIVDVEVFKNYGKGFWAQEMFLVHGYDDVLWTSDIDAACEYFKETLAKYRDEPCPACESLRLGAERK